MKIIIVKQRLTFFRVKLVFECDFEILWSLGSWDPGTVGPWDSWILGLWDLFPTPPPPQSFSYILLPPPISSSYFFLPYPTSSDQISLILIRGVSDEIEIADGPGPELDNFSSH